MNAIRSAGEPSRLLDIGCGRDKLPGAVGMDALPLANVDVVHDLDRFPWPFADDTFERVRAQDVLEHVQDFIGCMNEIHRVCRNAALVEVRMPFMTSVNLFTDPTHRRGGTSRTFEYFDPSKPLGGYDYSRARYDLLRFAYERGYPRGLIPSLFKQLDRLLVPICRRNAETYESYFAGIYPMHNVSYVLRVVKSGGRGA